MSKRNTIRLTESDLKRVIAESVKKILNEDITMNRKPLGGTEYNSYLANKISGMEFNDACNEIDKYSKGLDTRKQRRKEKYDYEGNPTWGMKGDEFRAIQQQDNRKQNVKDIKSMLYYNDIDYQTYKTLSDEEKQECWDTFLYYKQNPLARRRLEWERMGDPDWSLTW